METLEVVVVYGNSDVTTEQLCKETVWRNYREVKHRRIGVTTE